MAATLKDPASALGTLEHVRAIAPYQAGKPIDELAREYGLDPSRIVKLASNENPLGVPDSAKKAMAAAVEDLGRYPDANGFELKAALAARYSVPMNWITLGNGSNDILELAAAATLTPGRSCIYAQHSFAVYALATQARGALNLLLLLLTITAPAAAVDSRSPSVQQTLGLGTPTPVPPSTAVPTLPAPEVPAPVTVPSSPTAFDYTVNLNSEVFGAQLFTGSFARQGITPFNPDYTIGVGGQIQVRLWGGLEYDTVLTVDAQGNIFLPQVGPVKVLGTTNKNLQRVVQSAMRRVFRSNVFSYANLAAAQPVRVFVGGFVYRPGLYNGTSTDSLLQYLAQAGGIDAERGSFLDVQVKRGEQVRANVNLYDFLLKGKIPLVQLADGDVIFVPERALDRLGVVDGVTELWDAGMLVPIDPDQDGPGLAVERLRA